MDKAEISITFIGSALMRRLNREYLDHDWVTDVLAFNLSAGEPAGMDMPLVGDVYVCVPRALAQAARLNLEEEEELMRLTAHGVLHLLGYDHGKPAEAKMMSSLQEEYLNKFSHLPKVFV
ncbi:MAG: rRNA maturation RNase YbeY [Candidatus Glassbacteria bacterium]